MAKIEWRIIECPDCSGRFKVPQNLEDDEGVACPACGAEIHSTNPEPKAEPEIGWDSDLLSGIEAELDAEFESTESVAAPATPPPDHSPGAPGFAAPTSLLGSQLPPAPKKSMSLDLSNLVVKEANEQFRPPPSRSVSEEHSVPMLENLGRLSSTSDEAFTPVDEGPRERVTRSAVREEIAGWDEDDQGRWESSRSAVASTFKLALLALPLLIGVAFFAMNVKPKKLDKVEKITPIILNPQVDEEEKKPLAPHAVDDLWATLEKEEFYKRMVEVSEKFLAAETYKERLEFTRDPERVLPLMEHYYSTNPDGPTAIRSMSEASSVSLLKGFAVMRVILKDYGQLPIVLARSGDKLVVDWESFVGYSEMTFAEFAKKKPTTPVLFRVRARPEDYYNYGFGEDKYYCMGLSNLFLTDHIYGYVGKKSEAAQAIQSIFSRQAPLDFVIMRRRYPEKPESDNQVIVDEFVTDGWLLTPKEQTNAEPESATQPGEEESAEAAEAQPTTPN
jgi:hypothetical protein